MEKWDTVIASKHTIASIRRKWKYKGWKNQACPVIKRYVIAIAIQIGGLEQNGSGS
jgi:hypothetical protein